jgi:hypothetical protein
VVSNAPISVATASWEAVRCPSCGSGPEAIGFGGGYKDAPPLTASIMERASWWRNRGEIGTSSLTIWCAFIGKLSPHGRFDYPHDPDDFHRCKQLLDLIPEWRETLGEVVHRFSWFYPFSSRWNEFEALWAEESSKKRCPRLYDLMQVAGREAEAIRQGPTNKVSARVTPVEES